MPSKREREIEREGEVELQGKRRERNGGDVNGACGGLNGNEAISDSLETAA